MEKVSNVSTRADHALAAFTVARGQYGSIDRPEARRATAVSGPGLFSFEFTGALKQAVVAFSQI